MSGYVYIAKNNNNNYKIGYTSRNIEKRISNLRTASDSKISLLFSFQSENPIALEKSFHSMFSTKRICGEWFNLDDGDIKRISIMDGVKIHDDESAVFLHKEGIQLIVDFLKNKPFTHSLFYYLIMNMDNRNCIEITHKNLSNEMGCSIRTTIDAIQYLIEVEFLSVQKKGNRNIYIINSTIAWNNDIDKINTSYFSKKIAPPGG